MKQAIQNTLLLLLLLTSSAVATAQQRRPIDNEHPLWMIHVDVWNKADPQKIIDLIPEDIRPYICMNLSLSCQYDTEANVYKMPQNAVKTYRSWASVCQHNGLWFTCQPASGGHTHIQDDDLVTFEYFFKHYPNFLGWNYAEQFWGFDETGDLSSASQTARLALFAKLVKMSHEYGGFLTVSFCGNIWSHGLNPVGMMKRDKNLLQACRDYPEAILWLYKYTTSACFYNNETVTFGPFVSGLAKNYGVRYDICGWNGALDAMLGEDSGCKYPTAAGIGTVLEQTAINGGAVWDGPELIWKEDFQDLNNTTVDGYTRRNWGTFASFKNAWLDMFGKIIDGSIRIPSREEVVGRTKVILLNDVSTGSNEQQYATWGDLYDNLYKQDDPFNQGNGQWMNNMCYFKKTGRYGTIPMSIGLYDDLAKNIPVQVKKSAYATRWNTQAKKVSEFNSLYPEMSTGDLFVSRIDNQIVAYTPYTYFNAKTTARADIPLEYNNGDSLRLVFGKLSSGVIREYAGRIDLYLNNYRTDTTTTVMDTIIVTGLKQEPTFTLTKRAQAAGGSRKTWHESAGEFVLEVKHNGPIDVSIVTDPAAEQPSAAALPLPQQPEAWHGAVIIEAEDMDYKSVNACVTDPYGRYPSVRGHAGNGFIDTGTNKAGSLRHQLKLDNDGKYVISVRYVAKTTGGTLVATVNGTKTETVIEQTDANDWHLASFEADMKAGTNTLILNNTNGIPMYIDQVIYRPADVEEDKFEVSVREADNGTVTADVTEAAEGQTVTLTVTPANGYTLKELKVVNSVFFTMAKTIDIVPGTNQVTFAMPDDNVTIQPVFTDNDSAYKLDFGNVQSGALPYGWRCVQENSEEHAYPATYDAGARTMTGFSGYQGKALYWRNNCAEYGRLTAYPLTLDAGDYRLIYVMAAWKETPLYKTSIINASTGATVATSQTYTAAPNVNGSTSASIATATARTLSFTVKTTGNYIIKFSDATTASGYHEFLLLECRVNSAATSAIELVDADGRERTTIYDLRGRRLNTRPEHGVYIENGRKHVRP